MRARAWIAGLLGLTLCGCPAPPPDTRAPSPQLTSRPLTTYPQADWTLIFYFAADNDLEQAQMHDLNELVRLPDSDKLHLLALVDRSPLGEDSEGYSNQAVANLANWSGARLLRVCHDRLEEIDDWGKLNMADPASLKRLLRVAQDHFPARRTALFIVDHGQAWVGVCDDDSASQPGDSLDLKELHLALEGLKQPLDLLAFDACMMASLEVLLAVAPSSRYLVASQDSLPRQGLDYLGGLSPLLKNPQADGKQLGQWFLQSYRQSLTRDDVELSRLQLSLLATDQAGELQQHWNALARRLRSQADRQWQVLAQARAATASFQVDDPVNNQAMTMHDLSQLTRQWGTRLDGLEQPLKAVEKSLAQVRLDQVCGRFYRQCGGLSVYYPAQSTWLKQGPVDYTQQLEDWAPDWVAFLKQFTETRPDGQAVLSEVVLSSGGTDLEISARLGDPAEVDSSHTILAQGDRQVGQFPCRPEPGQATLHDSFNGTWLHVGERTGKVWLMAQVSRLEGVQAPERAMATVPMLLRRGEESRAPLDVQLYFAMEGSPTQVLGSFLGADRSSSLGRTRVDLRPGDQLSFREPSLVPGGHSEPGPWVHVVDPETLQLQLRPIEPGNYRLGFLVRDLQGRPSWKLRPLLWGE